MIPGLCSLLNKGAGSVGGFSATAAPTLTVTTGRGVVDSANFTATPMGGMGPYTYSWGIVLGDPSVSVRNPTLQTAFARSAVTLGDATQATILCNVTDSASHTAQTNQITVQFIYE